MNYIKKYRINFLCLQRKFEGRNAQVINSGLEEQTTNPEHNISLVYKAATFVTFISRVSEFSRNVATSIGQKVVEQIYQLNRSSCPDVVVWFLGILAGLCVRFVWWADDLLTAEAIAALSF